MTLFKQTLVAVCLSFCALMTQAATPRHYETVPGDPMQTRIYTLPNGLKVYLSVNKDKPRIQTSIAVRTGSRNDPAETTGLAHYLEHLMFKGTRSYGSSNPDAEKPYLDDIRNRYEHYRKLTDAAERKKAYHEIDSVSQLAARYNIPNEYDKLMAAIGSEGSNAFTSNDVTCYVEDIPSNEIATWARIQADRFQNMVIRGFHTELEAVYEEYNIHLTQDFDKLYEATNKVLYPTHPYGTQTTLGTQDHLKNPSIVNIENYFKKYYVPNNVAICMAGDFDPDQVMDILEREFGAWKASSKVERPEYAIQRYLTQPKDTTVVGTEVASVSLAWRFDGAATAQADTLKLIKEMLQNDKAGLMDVNLNQAMQVTQAIAMVDDMTDYSTLLLYAIPNKGQSLKEAKELMLKEVEKIKKGQFDEKMLQAVNANMKLDYYKSLDDNRERSMKMVYAFINNNPWQREVEQQKRLEGITKEQLMRFAQQHLGNSYVCVYKEEGVDTTQHKIEKPAITPIPSNRDMESALVREVRMAKTTPIAPLFPNFKKDVLSTRTAAGLPLYYKRNTEDGRFQLSFNFDFGDEDMLPMAYAAEYLEYVGTPTMTPAEIKKAFYALACEYSVTVGNSYTAITLSGLTENMPKALKLLRQLLTEAKADKESFDNYVNLKRKTLEYNKSDQRASYAALCDYVLYGAYNPHTHIIRTDSLAQMDPQALLHHLNNLTKMQQTVLYYGPLSQKELSKTLTNLWPTPKQLIAVPVGKEYNEQTTPVQSQVFIAPYEAKNIYMRMFHVGNTSWNSQEMAVKATFNEYFGGSMNSVVFQELRETRGLAYNAFAQYNSYPRFNHKEYYFTHIISQNDKMMDCVRTFKQILDSVPQSQAAFDIAKQSLEKNLRSTRYTKYNLLTQYLNAQRHGLNVTPSEIIYNNLSKVTMQDMINFEQKEMARKPYRYAILGDETQLDMNALKQLGTIHRLSTEEIFGE